MTDRMIKIRMQWLLPLFTLWVLTPASYAQQDQAPPYRNLYLSPEQRASDLVQRMTLEEKASQLINQARAIPRLGVPAYDWWSEALHGVISAGTTEFPEPIGLAATFDPAGIKEMATAIGVEGRIKHSMAIKAGHSDTFEGLDFWAPNINIFRDPRWGRGQETYGEDPFLTARMGVAYVQGLQGDDPTYYRAIATPKHYAVHSGPEPTRHSVNVTVSKHDELDTYLPAFRAAITEGKAGSIMCAYNSLNGEPACASKFLLQERLRKNWGFTGYVVSDCGAVIDIFQGHHFKPTQAEASAVAVQRGMDNECADPPFKVPGVNDFKPYVDAMKQGLLKVGDVDVALTRLFVARMKLGMFDPAEKVPYNTIPEDQLNSPAHRALALKLANESMVLLKNDGILPLKKPTLKLAVIGPLANQTNVLLGNYTGTPAKVVSILEGIQKEFPGADIKYVQGTQYLSHAAEPVPDSALSSDGKPGVKASYRKLDMTDMNKPVASASLIERIESSIDSARVSYPEQVRSVNPLEVRYESTLTPTQTGDYGLGVIATGNYIVRLNGKDVTSGYETRGQSATGIVHLQAGKPEDLVVIYRPNGSAPPDLRLVWSKVDLHPDPKALTAAREADVVVAVVGLTSELEGEEKSVDEPGFKGGDRTSLDLPKPEEDLLERLAEARKPMVVVLTNGSALSVNWAKTHANAILEAWYPGEEGGKAVAQTLSGKNNPSGRLPVTFYAGVDQLPPFENYSMEGRTYRYFSGVPLFPFGFGLSYTRFAYSSLKLSSPSLNAGETITAEVTVSNIGSLEGEEVAQLYLSFPQVAGAPLTALRGFRRVHLLPGKSQVVSFTLTPRDLSIVTEDGIVEVPAGAYKIAVGGGQPTASTQFTPAGFAVKGTKQLPQ